jgi:hypothetical protein
MRTLAASSVVLATAIMFASCSESDTVPASPGPVDSSAADVSVPNQIDASTDSSVQMDATPTPMDASDSGDAADAADAARVNLDSASRPGSRLLRELYIGGGTAFQNAFVDTQRKNALCAPALAEDGELRCLPIAYDQYVFTDASCTENNLVALTRTGFQPQPYIRVEGSQVCEPKNAVFEVGGPVAMPTTKYMRDSSTGACKVDGFMYTDVSAYSVLQKIAPSTFVKATRKPEAGATRLRREWIEFEDGAGAADSLYDTQFATTCQALPRSDFARACLPGPNGYLGFTDSSCSLAVAAADTCGKPPPAYVAGFFRAKDQNGFSAQAWEILRVGAPIQDVRYTRQDGMCSAVGFGGFFPELPRFSATIVPATDSVTLTQGFAGAGRIQRSVAKGADGSELALRQPLWGSISSSMYDQALAQRCAVLGFQKLDGLRCLPSGLSTGVAFSDASCTKPAISVLGLTGTDAKFVQSGTAMAPEFRRIGTVVKPATQLYILEAGVCKPSALPPGETVDLGPVESGSTFVEFTRSVE